MAHGVEIVNAAYGPPPGGPPPGGFGGPPPGGYGAPGGFGGPPPGGLPPPGGMPMAPPGGGPMMGGPGGGAGGDAIKSSANTWFIIGLVGILCCCPNLISLIGAIIANGAKGLVDQGNLAGAESKLKTGKMIVIIGLSLGILTWLGSVVLSLLGVIDFARMF